MNLGNHLGDHIRRALAFRLGTAAHAAGITVTGPADLTRFAINQSAPRTARPQT